MAAAADLDIEQPEALVAYLRSTGRIDAGESVDVRVLAGGVSNKTVLVERASGEAWVLKQALPKLRVKVDWFSDPARIHREALALRWLPQLAPAGTITPLVFEDPDHHLLAMAAVPQPHENWKTMLLTGSGLFPRHVQQFGRLLGTIHANAHARRAEVEPLFADRSFFESLRIEPYYAYTARQAPAAAWFLDGLIAETRATGLTVVHGDYSPKNVLVPRGGDLVLLDHEVIHWGDPAFDLGFALTHLLSKAHHLPAFRDAFADAATMFWESYIAALGDVPWRQGLEVRAVRHTLACLLARVAGRSPLEYLTPEERERQAQVVLGLTARRVSTVSELVWRFTKRISRPMPPIERVTALEILDSRGKPTVKATFAFRRMQPASASVPSGASTGAHEAHELRDGDPTRYCGQGCRKAVAGINGEIGERLRGKSVWDQGELDRALCEWDGTPDKSRLGANAILAVSLAHARAVATSRGQPLYRHLANLAGRAPDSLPRLTINLFSGGKHGGGQMPIQDVLVVPASAGTIDEGLAVTHAVYYAAADLALRKYGMRALTADEGGLAPPFPSVEAAFDDAVEAIRAAGYEPGRDVALAVDVASSHFYRDGRYHLAGGALGAAGMINRVQSWVERYPIVSVEDGLAEDDWHHWPALRERIGNAALVLGDDLLCTNPQRIRRAVETGACNALLLKVNQIGTLSEAAEALRLAKDAGWRVTISARSGETEDDWLADLAVGWGGDQIKVGSITQSERLAKYNRLLEIEAETRLPVVSWPGA